MYILHGIAALPRIPQSIHRHVGINVIIKLKLKHGHTRTRNAYRPIDVGWGPNGLLYTYAITYAIMHGEPRWAHLCAATSELHKIRANTHTHRNAQALRFNLLKIFNEMECISRNQCGAPVMFQMRVCAHVCVRARLAAPE